MTSDEMVPADEWLYSLLKTESCFVYGAVTFDEREIGTLYSMLLSELLMKKIAKTGYAMLHWSCALRVYDDSDRNNALELGSTLFEDFTCDGLTLLGHNLPVYRFLVSASNEFEFEKTSSDEDGAVWRKIGGSASWPWFEAVKGIIEPSFPLESVLEEMNSNSAKIDVLCVYAAEISTKQVERQPETLIAKLWHECLGARAIPFDPAAREALIADGCKHPELKRHIEAWQEMKRTGSKWVTGE